MAVNSINGNTLLETGFFPPCRAATTAAITLVGLKTIDGVVLLAGDRVLVKNQSSPALNGIYAASTGNWVRTTDASNNTQFFDGMAVTVAQGTLASGTVWLCTTTDDPVVVGTSLITFALQYNIQAGNLAGAVLLPQTYGATGKGIADDAAAVQNCLTAAALAGVAVFVPGGTYRIANGAQLTVPDNSRVECAPGAIFLRDVDPSGGYPSYTTAMIALGSKAVWRGGQFKSTIVTGTSTTSNTIGTGAKTFTTQAGLPLVATAFIHIGQAGNPANWLEGTITSYSGTTLVVSVSATGGSGTFASWSINLGGVYASPMVLHGSTQSLVEDVQVTGNWYVGIIMDGWNPASGGSLAVTDCTVRSSWAIAPFNRGFYQYGTVSDSTFDDCHVDGQSVTNYGFNGNPSNATGSANQQNRCSYINCTAISVMFQGFELAEATFDCIISGCRAYGGPSVFSVGFLIQVANAGAAPTGNVIVGCIAVNCASAGFELIGAFYCSITGSSAKLCGLGFYLNGNAGLNPCEYCLLSGCLAQACTVNGFEVGIDSVSCSLEGIQSIANTGSGVQVDAGSTHTRCSGRAAANGTNLLDNGTSTVNLLTVL